MINDFALQNKVHTLKAFPNLESSTVDRFIQALKVQGDWQLFRINPLKFAEQHGLDPQECTDLFIHGAKIGLFDMNYNMVCPMCGGIANSHHELDELEPNSFYCYVCDIDVPTALDGQVEVSFTIHPEIKALDIDPLKDEASYFKYHFSNNYEKTTELLAYSHNLLQQFCSLEPDEKTRIDLEGKLGHVCQLVSIDQDTACWVYFDQETPQTQQHVEINLLNNGFAPRELHLPVGNYQFTIQNHSRVKLGFVMFSFHYKEFRQMMTSHPPLTSPFLTASGLINNQSFRDLFRVQQLSESLNLNIKNLTVMFTDLRGSTAMYDEAGDMFAYQIVKKHFELLGNAVRKHSGSIVKTMGDAIMATFSSPLNGFLCALEMIQEIDQFNEEQKQHGYEIGLKVGLNSGSALTVVNDERLDYFGQSINIAARIQGLANASEIYLSQSIYDDANVIELLKQHEAYTAEKLSASLKGVGQAVEVYKINKTS
ncbi:DUF5939 domain-containing protein [Candidatus Albibeggiatoa sp. nov. NOAA]|uniref:adenylate/guanylate cyclase domain-containing protein n=1 Tax=Candidatus Albibeggiatoa sp. nov. NOAA TaxID=3162724 RepID=UPI0032F4FD5D|nr:adenylate/guanylate cyclase domain-containing protein [Thiotrichaceae bacterium]